MALAEEHVDEPEEVQREVESVGRGVYLMTHSSPLLRAAEDLRLWTKELHDDEVLVESTFSSSRHPPHSPPLSLRRTGGGT